MQVPETLLNLSRPVAGQPLPDTVRAKMETALGADLSDVRVHIGTEAGSIGALAFTYGSNIYFAPGLYNPTTIHGQRLLGHELVHVVQQRNGRVRNPFGSGVAVVQDPGLEAEADRLGMRAAAMPLTPAASAGSTEANPGIQAAAQPRSAGPSGKPPPAPHVAAAIDAAQGRAAQPRSPVAGMPAAPGQGPAPHVQAAIKAPAPGAAAAAPSRPAAQPKAGSYRLVIGSYMHQQGDGGRLPEDLAGHTFVSIKEPSGKSQTWGFSPQDYSHLDPNRDLGALRVGVQGKVHRDENAFEKPGVRTRSYHINKEQAQAAMAKVTEYRANRLPFSLQQRQCSSFALDVARAAEIDLFPGAKVKRPREIHRQL